MPAFSFSWGIGNENIDLWKKPRELIARKSTEVKPPGIEGCLAWAECVLLEEIACEKFVLVARKVVHLEVDDRFFNCAEGTFEA